MVVRRALGSLSTGHRLTASIAFGAGLLVALGYGSWLFYERQQEAKLADEAARLQALNRGLAMAARAKAIAEYQKLPDAVSMVVQGRALAASAKSLGPRWQFDGLVCERAACAIKWTTSKAAFAQIVQQFERDLLEDPKAKSARFSTDGKTAELVGVPMTGVVPLPDAIQVLPGEQHLAPHVADLRSLFTQWQSERFVTIPSAGDVAIEHADTLGAQVKKLRSQKVEMEGKASVVASAIPVIEEHLGIRLRAQKLSAKDDAVKVELIGMYEVLK